MKLTRRNFVVSGAVAGAGLMAGQPTETTGQAPHVLVQRTVKPVVVSSANGNRFKNDGMDVHCDGLPTTRAPDGLLDDGPDGREQSLALDHGPSATPITRRRQLLSEAVEQRLNLPRSGSRSQALLSGPEGGDAQIAARVATGGVDAVFFFVDPLSVQPLDPDIRALLASATSTTCRWRRI
jgi:hypothetical protein